MFISANSSSEVDEPPLQVRATLIKLLLMLIICDICKLKITQYHRPKHRRITKQGRSSEHLQTKKK